MMFEISQQFKPTGDQPEAIKKLANGAREGVRFQTLLGVTGSGKTFTMASVINKLSKPALVISPNKTLAAQLFQEFKEFFPKNAVHYFVSYYDYYQPEAYLPQTDTYIEKDARINQILDQLRHSAVNDVLTRKDFIVVASVSCIYNIGDPNIYQRISLEIKKGEKVKPDELIRQLVNLQYSRNETQAGPGNFRFKLNTLTVYSASGERKIEVEFKRNEVKEIIETSLKEDRSLRKLISIDLPYKKETKKVSSVKIFPAKFYLTEKEREDLAIFNIKKEMKNRAAFFKKHNRLLEAQRIEQRTNYDLQMIRTYGYCPGIENYSRHFEFRQPSSPPYTLLDYLPQDTLIFIDESHLTAPQIKAMAVGDRQRKEVLVQYGFRLPSAIDNRPLTFNEFFKKGFQTIFVSATPGELERKRSGQTVEQLIRPTGVLDPQIEVRPAKNQIKDVIKEINERVKRKERTLVISLTKRLAEEISEYFQEQGIKSHYLHSEVKTLQRPELLKELRLGEVDVVVGINLLREGLDLPEVSLVAILDADKEGFLRNETTLIQTIGRAARNINGLVIMYADKITYSMKKAIEETNRRRKIQEEYNKNHNITPKTIEKPIRQDIVEKELVVLEEESAEKRNILPALEKELKLAVKNWDFERAAKIRDKMKRIKGEGQ